MSSRNAVLQSLSAERIAIIRVKEQLETIVEEEINLGIHKQADKV